MPNTLEQIELNLPVVRVRVFTRAQECLYDNRPDAAKELRKPLAAKQAIMKERDRPMSNDELQDLKKAWERLSDMQAQRGATGEEISIVRGKLVELDEAITGNLEPEGMMR